MISERNKKIQRETILKSQWIVPDENVLITFIYSKRKWKSFIKSFEIIIYCFDILWFEKEKKDILKFWIVKKTSFIFGKPFKL